MRTKTTMKRSLERTLLTCTMSLLAAACGVEGEDGELDNGQDELSGPESSLVGAAAPAQLEVSANGSGCPSGTWKAELAPDKRSFNLSLSGFSAEVARDTTVASKSCQLAIKVKGGYSYALQGLSYVGEATLAQGVTAKAGAAFGFQGAGINLPETVTSLTGPRNGAFSVQRTLSDSELAWSTCGVERNINVSTRLSLQSATPGATGSIKVTNLAGIVADANNTSAIGFRVAVRPCNGQVATPTPTPTPTPAPSGRVGIASITANGSGCPSGAWTAERAQDGTALSVSFLGYEAKADANTSIAVKDCSLAVKVNNPAGTSYALTSATYTGRATVNPGASAILSTSYAFQGNPSVSATGGKTFTAGEAFSFQDTIADGRAVWSQCGVTRDLNITTRVRVTGGTGSIGLSRLSDIKLSTKPCTGLSSQVELPSSPFDAEEAEQTTEGPSVGSVTRS